VKAAAVGTYDEILRNFSAKKNAKKSDPILICGIRSFSLPLLALKPFIRFFYASCDSAAVPTSTLNLSSWKLIEQLETVVRGAKY